MPSTSRGSSLAPSWPPRGCLVWALSAHFSGYTNICTHVCNAGIYLVASTQLRSTRKTRGSATAMTTGQNEEPNFKDNVTNHDHTHNAPIAKATFSTPCVGIRCSYSQHSTQDYQASLYCGVL